MSLVETSPRLTAAELAVMPDEGAFELVDGELREKRMGAESAWIAGEVFAYIREICRYGRLGWAFGTEVGYRCFPDDPDRVRRPDASFVRAGRLPGERLPEGFVTLPPDLAVEVISPHDLAEEVERKVDEYLRAGVRLVWVLSPKTRSVRVHRLDGSISGLRGGDELTGDDVLPGFRCPVNVLFPPPAP
ncbi:MAG: Uma2 family endonuclease [Isosphaeraceae bacterium]